MLAPRIPPLDPDAAPNVELARRLRIAITLSVAPILLFAAFDLALVPRRELPIFWTIRLAALVVIGLSVALLRQRRAYSRRRLIAVGLACVGAMYALSTTSALLAGDSQTTGTW